MHDWENQAIDLLKTTTLSYNQIATRVGRGRDAVVRLCRIHAIERPNKPVGPVKMTEMNKLSPQHIALGLKLSRYRNDISASEMAKRLGVSRYVLRTMEFGLHDFTLTQLLRISELLGLTLDQLTETMNGRLKS
jgi:DNA-binding XRE family transcriptional regulator